MRVLVVTPDAALCRSVGERLSSNATVHMCAGFEDARRRLSGRYDLLISDLRLGDFNGLHLAHLVRHLMLPTRCVVFSSHYDAGFAAEVIAAGAFYEHADHIAAVAPAYLTGALPAGVCGSDPAAFLEYMPGQARFTDAAHESAQASDGGASASPFVSVGFPPRTHWHN
jgi:CheY-like chemotaxis protein